MNVDYSQSVDEEHEYGIDELRSMSVPELAALVIRLQRDRWFSRVASAGTVKLVIGVKEQLALALAELECERQEVARLRDQLRARD